MTIFLWIINSIESFLYTGYLAFQFDVKKKNLFVFFATIIQIGLLWIGDRLGYNGLFLTTSIIASMIIFLIFWTKKIKFDYFYLTVFYNTLLILCALISLSILTYLKINSQNLFIIFASSIAKVLQLVITIILFINKESLITTLDIYNWRYIIIYDSANMCILTVIGYHFLIQGYLSGILQIVLLLSCILWFASKIIVTKINEVNANRMEQEKIILIKEMNKQKESLIKKAQEDINIADHRMFYILLQMENYLNQKEYDKLSDLIQIYRKMISQYKLVSNSGNDIFDVMYSLTTNELILSNKDISTTISISKQSYYNSIQFIDFMTRLIKCLEKSNIINIALNEISNILLIRVIFNGGSEDENRLKELINHSEYNIIWNDAHSETDGFRITIEFNEEEYEIY